MNLLVLKFPKIKFFFSVALIIFCCIQTNFICHYRLYFLIFIRDFIFPTVLQNKAIYFFLSFSYFLTNELQIFNSPLVYLLCLFSCRLPNLFQLLFKKKFCQSLNKSSKLLNCFRRNKNMNFFYSYFIKKLKRKSFTLK